MMFVAAVYGAGMVTGAAVLYGVAIACEELGRVRRKKLYRKQ
jgi:hypothetical protein